MDNHAVQERYVGAKRVNINSCLGLVWFGVGVAVVRPSYRGMFLL